MTETTGVGCTGATVTARKDVIAAFNTIVTGVAACSKHLSVCLFVCLSIHLSNLIYSNLS